MRELKTQSVKFNYAKDDEPSVQFSRTVNSVAPDATDTQILQHGRALMRLVAGTSLVSSDLTQHHDLHD